MAIAHHDKSERVNGGPLLLVHDRYAIVRGKEPVYYIAQLPRNHALEPWMSVGSFVKKKNVQQEVTYQRPDSDHQLPIKMQVIDWTPDRDAAVATIRKYGAVPDAPSADHLAA